MKFSMNEKHSVCNLKFPTWTELFKAYDRKKSKLP